MIDAHRAAGGAIVETGAAGVGIARQRLPGAEARRPRIPLRLHHRRRFQHREGRRRAARLFGGVADGAAAGDAATIARAPRLHLAVHGLAEQCAELNAVFWVPLVPSPESWSSTRSEPACSSRV